MTYYVYAPTTGKSLVHPNSSYCYLSGNHPGTCGFAYSQYNSKPFDLGYVTNTTCRLYTSSNILSVRTTRKNNCVCDGGACDNVNDAVRVDLYRGYNATLWVGAVLFAHLQDWSRPANATLNYPNFSGIQLGVLAADDCDTQCYGGVHVHMATEAGVLNPAANCDVQFYVYGSWIYKFMAI
jgi:hypothetical protein